MEETRKTALGLLTQGSVTLDNLWIAFYGVGGSADPLELEAYIYGLMPVSLIDAELLSDALLVLQEH